MEKNIGKLGKLLTFIGVCVGSFTSIDAMAEGSPIYYDSFYEDYYKAIPDKKPKAKAPKTVQYQQAQPVYDPYMQYQTNAMYAQSVYPYTSFYQTSVDHPIKKFDVDLQYKKNKAHFMFKSDVGSILNWDEVDTNETLFKVSRDFMVKNRQYVFTATYGTGSGTTSRTSDDDIYNEAHIISLGSGDVQLKTFSIALGMRNLWKLGNWDLTPYIGYKQKKTDFTMFDHATPSTFYLDYFCTYADGSDGTVQMADGSVYENVCTSGIKLTDHAQSSYWQGVTYYTDADGNEIAGTVSDADLFIPGAVEQFNTVNLSAGDQIYQEDYCYVAMSGNNVCISAGDDGTPLLLAFGGVSSVYIQDGITHMYFVNWSGPFVGLNFERKISDKEDLTFYAEYFRPHYKVWGNWPNRTDWMHDPSFNDEGGSGVGYTLDFAYKYKIFNNSMFTVAANYEFLQNKNATTTLYFADGEVGVYPDAILLSEWYSYGLTFGLSFRF